MYDANTIAKYIICYESEQLRAVSNLRLQKLLYFVQAQFLVSKKEPCFSDSIEAWDFGPVVPTVYHEYKIFGSSSIPTSITMKDIFIDPYDRKIIESMLDNCAKYATSTLVGMTHRQRPWIEAYNRKIDNTISNEAILAFFGG